MSLVMKYRNVYYKKQRQTNTAVIYLSSVSAI
jgi:hypothetical protein